MSVLLVDNQRPTTQAGNNTTETTLYTASLVALANGAHFNCLWVLKSRINAGAGTTRTIRIKFGSSTFSWSFAISAAMESHHYSILGRIHRTNGLAGPNNHVAFFSGRIWTSLLANYDAGNATYNNPGSIQGNATAAVNQSADPITLALSFQWDAAPGTDPSAQCVYGRVVKSTP